MAPKQGNLKYVKNSQSSLGKFFSKPNGSNPDPPKQSTLSFATKSTTIKKKETASGSAKDEDIEMKEEGSASASKSDPGDEESKDLKDTKKRSRSPETTKTSMKREVKVESEDDDDEPILKRPRRGGKEESRSPSAKPIRSPPAKTESPPKSKTIPKVEESPRKAAAQKQESETEALESSAASSEVDEDPDEDVDEGVKPSVAAKAREKVQSTLSSNHKDPYPDWKPGEPVPYAALCTTFSLIEMTTKRLIITAHCSLFLRQVIRLTPNDLLPTVLLMIGKLAAEHTGIELGIGESLIMKAIGESTGRSLPVIKQDQKETGDLGLVAVKSRGKQPTMFKPKPLTVRGVHKGLMDIATTSGSGAQGRKVDGIKKLLSASDGHVSAKFDINKDKGGASEAKFVVRFLEGKLRLGLANPTVLVSLAQAMVCHEIESTGSNKLPSTDQLAKGEALLKLIYSELPSYEVIIPAMLDHGIFNLREHCHLRPGIPLKPMLAKPTKAITEVLDRFENQNFTCEYKYDGERAQIHYVAADSTETYSGDRSSTEKTSHGIAAIFSRNSETLSHKYPDILANLDRWIKSDTKSFVLDCETVAWDCVEKKVLPFQQLQTRKRKDVKVEDIKVKVCVFAFDLLLLNGEAVVKKSLRERRELLHTAFTPLEGEFTFATSMDGRELDEIQHFLDDSVKASCEGLMVKMLDGTESGYEPSKRSRNWLKIKKDYLSGIGDSLDLVVIGAYYGKGKRTSVFGAFLLACYNSSSDTYETVCNIGTGFSEIVLEELHEQLKEITINAPKPFYSHSTGNQHQPDVWLEPRYVWEVKTADLTLSPKYRAGGHEGVDPAGDKGVSLRFPRFIKIRDDKKPDMATTSRQVAEMYRKQESIAKSKGPAVDDDFEY